MIEQNAFVISSNDEFAWVEVQRQSTCGQCAAQKGCGTSVLSKVLGRKMNNIKVLNPPGAQAGDQVVIGLHENVLLKSAVISYLLPLVLMFTGALLFQSLFEVANEVVTVAGATLGFVAALWVLKLFSVRKKSDPDYQPVILRVAGKVNQNIIVNGQIV